MSILVYVFSYSVSPVASNDRAEWRLSGFSQPRQCGDKVLRITGIWKHARHRREVADIAVDDAEQRDDRGLVRRDAVEVAHCKWIATAADAEQSLLA